MKYETKDLIKGDADWHEIINDNFKTVSQSVSNPEQFVYRFSGVSQVEEQYKTFFDEKQMKIVLVRTASKVDAYLRVCAKDYTKLNNNLLSIFNIPEGFRFDNSIRVDTWNVPLTVTQYTYPQGNFGALYEMDTKSIKFGTNRNGNIYIHGSWHTADPFPEPQVK
ncbi:hypothetical protein [Enterococcus faecalis]|uniref:hypothetical protein n=1 Tax=Enterococcus faecalis TaxID=1351 RepID=UPI00032F02E3|nr:hypothetical protein [Enterococcus faecalis]EOJ20337.1 hypothetical protein UMS_00478 [Enterococcus faecalis EnGen0287]